MVTLQGMDGMHIFRSACQPSWRVGPNYGEFIYNPFHSGLGLKQDLVASPVAADQKCGTMLRTMYVKFGLREKFGVTCSLISNSNIASRISNILKPSLTWYSQLWDRVACYSKSMFQERGLPGRTLFRNTSLARLASHKSRQRGFSSFLDLIWIPSPHRLDLSHRPEA